MPESTNRLNPQIASIEIGVRNLRTIKIYPLSLADQLKMTDLISKTLSAFFEGKEAQDVPEAEFVKFLVSMIQENIGRILTLVTDEEGSNLLEDMTNEQTTDIALKIFEVNYEGAGKKVKSLVGKVKNLFLLTRPSPEFSTTIQDIDLKTVTENPSEKEVSQETK